MGKIVVQSQQHHEHKKHADRAQEVPDVVVIVKEQRALVVELPGLRRVQLQNTKIINTNCTDSIDAVPPRRCLSAGKSAWRRRRRSTRSPRRST